MKLNSNWVFIAYYIFALLVVFGTGYVVFVLKNSGWWFLMCLVLLQLQPTTKKD